MGVMTIEIPNYAGPILYMAGGITLIRTQHQATIPGAKLYVSIWQGTDPATGQLVQGWRWALYYD
jgi:hypothetical protein